MDGPWWNLQVPQNAAYWVGFHRAGSKQKETTLLDQHSTSSKASPCQESPFHICTEFPPGWNSAWRENWGLNSCTIFILSLLQNKVIYFMFLVFVSYSSSSSAVLRICLCGESTLYALGLDACLHNSKLKWRLPLQAFLQLEQGYYWLFTIAVPLECKPTSWLRLPVASKDATETQDADFCINGFLRLLIRLLYTYLHMPSWGSWWS